VSKRFALRAASAFVALALCTPCYGQGKGGGKNPAKGPTRPPSAAVISAPSGGAAASGVDDGVDGNAAAATTATQTPFAWLDDASVIDAGSVWVSVAMARWFGPGDSQTIVPVVDASVGLSRRIQLDASVPRVAGALGPTFFGVKALLIDDEARAFRLSVAPTLQVVDSPVTIGALSHESRARWGLPVSAHVDRAASRFFLSSGYFSPGIWYAGVGVGRSLTDRVGASGSFSHSWTNAPSAAPDLEAMGMRRSEISGGMSYDVGPHLTVSGSVSRTVGVADDMGAGTTLAFGLSTSLSPRTVTK
jgi:hypothetical protein